MEQCRLIVLVAGYGETARDICCRNSRSVVRVHQVYFSSGTGFQKRYYLVAKMPKHPTSHRNGYVVVLPIQMYKSQTLNLPPRVLRQVIEAAVTFELAALMMTNSKSVIKVDGSD